MDALKRAMSDLIANDEVPLGDRYKDHALVGSKQGFRSIHVDSAPNPPKDKWVLVYKVDGDEIAFVRTGTHEDVYGRWAAQR